MQPTRAGLAKCHGVAFVLRADAPLPDLRPLRDAVRGMWRGRLPDDASRTLFLAAFTRPLPIDPDAWPTVLPLRLAGAATLSSFAGQDPLSPDRAAATPAGEVRSCDLWWAGRLHRMALAALEPVPLASLWDMPRLDLHVPVPRSRVPLMRASAATERGETAGRLTPVSRAAVSIEREGADLLRDMAEQLRADEQRLRLASIARQALRGLVGLIPAIPAGGGGGSDGSGGGGVPQAPRVPGFLANIAGWLRWHTPLGRGLRSQYDRRLGLVEKMISAGDLDAALRLALKLGSGNPGRKPLSRYPNALPQMRARLDFDLADEGFSAPILNGAGFYALRGRYLQLAEQLERDGDFRRAAYIHSQLLSDHQRAVLVLEKGGLFSEAAKLALDSRQAPALAIRVLFRAGDLDAALGLAKRTACFDALAEDSRVKEPAFHAFVIKAWTDALIATGQPLRALQVTDHLTAAAPVDDALLETRRRWLAAALVVSKAEAFAGELAVRAILTARWDGTDLSPAEVAAFPYMPVRSAVPHGAALYWVQAALRGDTEQPEEAVIELLTVLSRLASAASPEQADFWKGPAQPFVEAFVRAAIATASSRLSTRDLQALRSILGDAGLAVLETDIGKLAKLHVAPPPPDREWLVPPAISARPPVRCACVLANGNLLVWRESRLLQLLDPYGATLWQQNASDVTALVAVGSSGHVILVQAQRDGTSLLTRLATHNGTFHTIGKVALAAYHDVTSETQWLVQIGGEIGALDLAKLCAPSPQIEFLWSCSLTDRLRAIAFSHHADGPSWVTVDTSRERGGVLEIWTLHPNGKLSTSICFSPDAAEPRAPSDWLWDHRKNVHRMKTKHGGVTAWLTIQPWSEDQEERARMAAAERMRSEIGRFDTVQAGDFGRRHVTAIVDENGDAVIYVAQSADEVRPLMLRNAQGLFCLARGVETRNGEVSTVLLADEHGRIFAVGSQRVSIF
ncbi:hypothetical protein [Sphingomonas kyeonggiensis]|uniref:Tetratricopeptide (TPR) repeat protein n=1 Tax=Sphingomonas kyeonggiensis TaxID=1268553 RepID=A0A7W6NWD0_9SPHN|nr:hypothetical protein [Sphingomonas kyeonggiensis]MBB4098078.1 tetratricopeptide (TPR) repeat protein [Sphingomonas kyeonggiensis]